MAVNSFVKENHTYQFAETLARYFADCRFVFLVRDPRDVASSWVRTDSIPGGIEKAVDTWVEDQTGTLAVCDVLRREERVFMLRYEDLISQSVEQLNALAHFFELPFTDSIFDFYKHPRTSANAKRIQAWKNIGRPIMPTTAASSKVYCPILKSDMWSCVADGSWRGSDMPSARVAMRYSTPMRWSDCGSI